MVTIDGRTYEVIHQPHPLLSRVEPFMARPAPHQTIALAAWQRMMDRLRFHAFERPWAELQAEICAVQWEGFTAMLRRAG